MKPLGLAIALTFTFAASFAGAAEKAQKGAAKTYDFSAVTDYMDAGYQSLGLPGASLLVVKDDKVLYEKYFGTFTPKTVVQIASSSKWLSAAVIMTLVDEGKINLDAKLSTYMPQFIGKRGEPTVRQMLSHTSGMIEPANERNRWDYSMTMAEYADRMSREAIMAGDPGTGIRYASVSMQLMGAIAEKVTGKTWNQLVKERIADPCDMPDTTYVRTPGTTLPANLNDPTANPMLAAGAKSSLHDYGHFLEMLANKGVYKGRRVISEKSVMEMQRDQTGTQPLLRASNDRMGRASHYGLGEWIDVQAPDGRTIQVSSPGAWGFRPWLNHDRNLYAVFMMQRKVGGPVINANFDPWKLIDLVHASVDEGPKSQTPLTSAAR